MLYICSVNTSCHLDLCCTYIYPCCNEGIKTIYGYYFTNSSDLRSADSIHDFRPYVSVTGFAFYIAVYCGFTLVQ